MIIIIVITSFYFQISNDYQGLSNLGHNSDINLHYYLIYRFGFFQKQMILFFQFVNLLDGDSSHLDSYSIKLNYFHYFSNQYWIIEILDEKIGC